MPDAPKTDGSGPGPLSPDDELQAALHAYAEWIYEHATSLGERVQPIAGVEQNAAFLEFLYAFTFQAINFIGQETEQRGIKRDTADALLEAVDNAIFPYALLTKFGVDRSGPGFDDWYIAQHTAMEQRNDHFSGMPLFFSEGETPVGTAFWEICIQAALSAGVAPHDNMNVMLNSMDLAAQVVSFMMPMTKAIVDVFQAAAVPSVIETESSEMDYTMLMALANPDALGPNDLIQRAGDARWYWISTVRVPIALGWQTALFDRSQAEWLNHPLFQIVEMENPIVAIVNHLTTIAMVGEHDREWWPTGQHAGSPDNGAWGGLVSQVEAEVALVSHSDLRDLAAIYTRVRQRYGCQHV